MSEYVYQPYPAWRFHPTKPAVVVASAAEDEQLGDGWVDSHLKLGPLVPGRGGASDALPVPPADAPPASPDGRPAPLDAPPDPAKKRSHKKIPR